MNNKYTLIKIISSPVICFITLITTKIGIDYYPLIFGLVIGLVNWKDHKNGLFIGIILNVFISYICFFIAYFSFPLFLGVFKPLLGEDAAAITVMTLSAFFFAPLLVFFGYKFIFTYPNDKYILKVIAVSIFTLVLICLLFYYFEIGNGLSLILWQVIMALAIQLIIQQKELKKG